MNSNQNGIIRVQKDKSNPYVMMNKGFLNDERLSFKAKGILAYLLSKPDNWQVRVSDLVKHSPEGRTAIYSGLNELKEFGYLERYPVRIDGKIHHWESVVYEVATTPKNHVVENTQIEENEDFQENDNVDFQLSGNAEIENVEIEKPSRNNKRVLINKENNSQSINQDEPTIEDLYEQSQIELFEDEEVKDSVKQAIKELYDEPQARETIKRVKIEHLTEALSRMQSEQSEKPINNPMQYFKRILVSCIVSAGFKNGLFKSKN
jgi:hypothetical protein